MPIKTVANDGVPVLEMPVLLPSDGRQVWYFPGARDSGHADLIARVNRRDGSSWIACLARRDWFLSNTVEAFVMPCGQRVFLSGGVADRDEPKSWRPLQMRGMALPTWSSDRTIVVFCDGLSLEVFGPEGPLWSVRDIAEISVTIVTAEALVCGAYDMTTGGNVERRFETRTGQAI